MLWEGAAGAPTPADLAVTERVALTTLAEIRLVMGPRRLTSLLRSVIAGRQMSFLRGREFIPGRAFPIESGNSR
ncbi:hypothetical protein GCM10009782_30750 [Glycomyces algeriensis]